MLTEERNKKVIFKLVSKYFSLNVASLKKFEKKLYNPDIDEVYKNILDGAKDYRIKLSVPDSILSDLDKGWEYFCYDFGSFVRKYQVTYKDFRRNKIKIGKQEIKIFKALCDYYKGFPDMDEDRIKYLMERVGSKKYPKKQTCLVLSLNFADWFMNATAENWSSCLNLDSDYEGAYWAGLPGLISDKNRAILYLTNGQKKEYRDIVVDKFFSRSWLLLDEKNMINIVKFYPNKVIGKTATNRIFGTSKFIHLNHYSSKHKVDLLFHINGFSSYIYQDGTGFCNKGYLESADSGVYCYNNKMRCCSRDLFYCRGGLSELIGNKKNIEENTDSDCCQNCGARGYDEIEVDGYYYCESCISGYTKECIECGELHINSYNWISVDSGYVCEDCYKKHYVKCHQCNEHTHRDNITCISGDELCESCFEDACENKEVFECCDCEEWHYIEDKFVEYNDEKTCMICYRKSMDKYQLKFDFAA